MMHRWVTAVAFAVIVLSGCGGVEQDTPPQAPLDDKSASELCLLFRGVAESREAACSYAKRDAQAYCSQFGTGATRVKTCKVVWQDEWSYTVDLSACCPGAFPGGEVQSE